MQQNFRAGLGRKHSRCGARMLLGAAALLASAFSGPSTRAEDTKAVVIARDMDFGSLDPARGYCDTCEIYFNATYDTLIGLTPKNAYVPLIATSWESNADQTRFTFHLNPKATFSDGTPVTSKDVAWTFKRLHNLKASPSLVVDGLKTVETPDPLTAIVVFDTPNSEALGGLSSPFAGIINSSEAAKHGAIATDDASTRDTSDAAFQAASMGSGPFVLESFKPNDALVLKRNPTYWGKPAGVAEVIVKEVKDAVGQAQMLQTGGADLATQIDLDTANSLHDDKLSVETQPSYNFIYLALQPNAPGVNGKLKPEVREAIRDAIDYQGLMDFVVGGKGRLLSAPVAPGFPGTAGLDTPAHDTAKAKALMAKAGVGALSLDAFYPAMNVYGADLSTMMQKIQQDLAKIDIKLNLQPLTYAVFTDKMQAGTTPMYAMFFAPDYAGTGDYLKYFGLIPGTFMAQSTGFAKVPQELNSKEADLFKKALAEKGSQADALFHQAAEQMIDDKIVLPLLNPDLVVVRSRDLKGVTSSAISNILLPELHR